MSSGPKPPRVPDDLLPHLRRARDLADRWFDEPLDLHALAAAAGVSKYHFLRCFAAEYGETPMQYLTRRRIERVQDLLRATNLTVTEVCHLVGYSSLGSARGSVSWSVRARRRTSVRKPARRRFRVVMCSCSASSVQRSMLEVGP